MLVVRKTTETKKKLTVSQPTLLKGEGEVQLNSHIGGLIIFVKDCRIIFFREKENLISASNISDLMHN